jgi:hypothetical protein
MFALGALSEVVRETAPLKDRMQIGIEVAVRQDFKGSRKKFANQDIVIWKEPCCTAWSAPSRDEPVPLAVLEWKVYSDEKSGGVSSRELGEMRKWLEGFTEEYPHSVGFGIVLDLRSTPSLDHKVERYQGGARIGDLASHL